MPVGGCPPCWPVNRYRVLGDARERANRVLKVSGVREEIAGWAPTIAPPAPHEAFVCACRLSRPIDVAVVVLLEQNLPLVLRFAVPVALAGATLHDRGALLAFAVDVGAGVEAVLEHADHGAVADRAPLKRGQLLAVGWAWEVDLFRGQRQQDWPRAA